MRPPYLVAFVGALTLACGGGASDAPPANTPPKPSASAATSATPLPTAPYTLKRSQIREALKAPALVLQNVVLDYDHPVFAGGKFYGFRVLEVRGGPDWAAIDLKSGDVVTAINGFRVERPESVGQAMETLVVASELRVDLDRNGESRALRFAIVDD
jgi:type II secretory pathway component PulC